MSTSTKPAVDACTHVCTQVDETIAGALALAILARMPSSSVAPVPPVATVRDTTCPRGVSKKNRRETGALLTRDMTRAEGR